MTVTFTTPGTIELAALTTFGISVKETENPIGFFGTGFKYAVAVILRCGGEVSVISNNKHHKFSLKTITVRNVAFKIVCLDDQHLAFTTELGKNWEPWMALRELYSNTLDEKGTHHFGQPTENTNCTHIVVSHCQAFDFAYAHRSQYFLETTPIDRIGYIDLHEGPSNFLYYRGIRVAELEYPSLYTYNLVTPQELTEDRSLRYHYMAQNAVAISLVTSKNKNFIATAVTAPKQNYEYSLNPCSFYLPSPEFLKVLEDLRNGPQRDLIHPKWQTLYLASQPKTELISQPPTAEQETMLEVAFQVAKALGISTHPVEISANLGTNILGLYRNNTIYIAETTFIKGQRTLTGTYLEELLHANYKFEDESRNLQNYLIDQLAAYGEYKLSHQQKDTHSP